MKNLTQILETEASTNATAGVATVATPLFSTRRFAGYDDHVIPEDHYLTIRNGRERMARWDTHLPDTSIKAAVQKSLYRDGTCLVTNAKSGLSVMLKHAIQRRAQKAQDIDATMMSYESTEEDGPGLDLEALNEGFQGDFTVFDEAQVAPLIAVPGEDYEFDEDEDEDYIQAYGFYSEDLGKSDDEADAFAQIVACFFDNVYSSADISDTIDSMFNAAVTEVKTGSTSLGLDDITIQMIHDAKKYIEENYDVITGQPTDDGDYEFDLPGDADDADIYIGEAAALAELPMVSPEDPSKDENEGWAIVNIKGNKVIDKPKKGETMEHKSNWLTEYYGASGAGAGMEVAWVNVKTGVVTKVKDESAGKAKK